MIDPLAQQYGVAGAFCIAVLYLVLKFRPWKNGNGKRGISSGDLDPADWEGRFRRLMDAALVSHDATRNEDIRKIVRNEMRYFYGLGKREIEP